MYYEERRGAVSMVSSAQQLNKANGSRMYGVLKRSLDIGTSLAVCGAGALPVAIICAAIRIESPGAPLFRQNRVGVNGKPFVMWKLRSMYIDAEKNVANYLTPKQLDEWECERKVKNDPRVPRIGQLLRKTSLDELPQFINVLLGDMSVVGPRPVTTEELHWFGDDIGEVLTVRPGVTGYWQAYTRNEATWESGERQQMVLYYVRNASVALDAKIFLRTFSAVFKMTGR